MKIQIALVLLVVIVGCTNVDAQFRTMRNMIGRLRGNVTPPPAPQSKGVGSMMAEQVSSVFGWKRTMTTLGNLVDAIPSDVMGMLSTTAAAKLKVGDEIINNMEIVSNLLTRIFQSVENALTNGGILTNWVKMVTDIMSAIPELAMGIFKLVLAEVNVFNILPNVSKYAMELPFEWFKDLGDHIPIIGALGNMASTVMLGANGLAGLGGALNLGLGGLGSLGGALNLGGLGGAGGAGGNMMGNLGDAAGQLMNGGNPADIGRGMASDAAGRAGGAAGQAIGQQFGGRLGGYAGQQLGKQIGSGAANAALSGNVNGMMDAGRMVGRAGGMLGGSYF